MGDNYYATMPKEDCLSPGTRSPQLFAVPTNPTAPAGTIATGVDISHHNGSINFAELKKSVDFVILRCGYGSDDPEQDDRKFEANVKGCIENNIPFGIYLYSYADTLEKAQSEAIHTLRLLKQSSDWGAVLSLPIFYDMESDAQEKVSNPMKVAIAKTYCSTLQYYGLPVGIYANTYWWENYLTDSYFKTIPYHWVARYNSTLGYSGKCDIWQCSETAVLPNLGKGWDLNYMFRDIFLNLSLKDIMQKVDLTSPYSNPIYPINTCSISAIPVQAYTGSAIKPSVSISYGKTSFAAGSGKDYTLSYSSNINPGLATVTIRGNGAKLTGTLKKTFVIKTKKVTLSSVKRISKGGNISWKKAIGASGYQIAYQKKGSKSWSFLSTTKLSKKITKLKKKTSYRVMVRAYKTINNKKYYGAYSSSKSWKSIR